jgi:hypothetical protein
MKQDQSPQEYFRLILLTVVGQAFAAAGYTLDERPAQWAGGLFRFIKTLPNGAQSAIEFQQLHYAGDAPSRFRVSLSRSDWPNTPRTLSQLVVSDFRVAILPSEDYWWTFADVTELGKALAEAGHLVIGFGIPWLAGDLVPPAG